MGCILIYELSREVARRRSTPTNDVDNCRTDRDANCPKGSIPASVVFYADHDGFFDQRASILVGQYPAIVSGRLRQGPKMVSSAGFAWLSLRPQGVAVALWT
jgi:hypothetical protein